MNKITRVFCSAPHKLTLSKQSEDMPMNCPNCNIKMRETGYTRDRDSQTHNYVCKRCGLTMEYFEARRKKKK